MKQGKETQYEYKCIDGNWTIYPVAYCSYHKGVLTAKMIKVHKCYKKRNGKGCVQLKEVEFE